MFSQTLGRVLLEQNTVQGGSQARPPDCSGRSGPCPLQPAKVVVGANEAWPPRPDPSPAAPHLASSVVGRKVRTQSVQGLGPGELSQPFTSEAEAGAEAKGRGLEVQLSAVQLRWQKPWQADAIGAGRTTTVAARGWVLSWSLVGLRAGLRFQPQIPLRRGRKERWGRGSRAPGKTAVDSRSVAAGGSWRRSPGGGGVMATGFSPSAGSWPDSDLPSIGVRPWAWGATSPLGVEPETARRGPGSHISAGRDLGLTFFDTGPIPMERAASRARSEVLPRRPFSAPCRRPRLAEALCVATSWRRFPWSAGSKRLMPRAFEARGTPCCEESSTGCSLAWQPRARYAPWQAGRLCWTVWPIWWTRQGVASLGLSEPGAARLS